jgi:hypothetical protein
MFMNTPAFHRVKYPNRITIKDVVINLKRICIPVKTNKQPFVFGVIAVNATVIFNGINSPPNIVLAYAVFEGRLTKLDVNVHVFSIQRFPHAVKVFNQLQRAE